MKLTELKILYERGHFMRAFEERIAASSDAGHVPGLVHLASGAELVELAVIYQLSGPLDQVSGSHRSHGLALACGVDPLALAREILGRAGGLSNGLGGTQHLLAPESGFLTSNGIVGGQVPLAAGAALSAKTLRTGGIAVAFMGDGAVNQGAVFETINLAVSLQLPLLFVVENNGLGQSTASAYATAGSLIGRTRAFGIAAEQVDGSDMPLLLRTADRLVSWVRKTCSPAFIEAKVPRISGHYHGDTQGYLGTQKVADPLVCFREILGKTGCEEDELNELELGARLKAEEIVGKAESSKDKSDEALVAWQQGGGF